MQRCNTHIFTRYRHHPHHETKKQTSSPVPAVGISPARRQHTWAFRPSSLPPPTDGTLHNKSIQPDGRRNQAR